jgi:hypothetical protein
MILWSCSLVSKLMRDQKKKRKEKKKEKEKKKNLYQN